jgi:hypothetical protein
MWPVLNGCSRSSRRRGAVRQKHTVRSGHIAPVAPPLGQSSIIESLWDDANVDSRTDCPARPGHSALAGRTITRRCGRGRLVALLRPSWPTLCREPNSSHRPDGRQRLLKLISTRRNDCRPRYVRTTQRCRPAAWLWDSSRNGRSG